MPTNSIINPRTLGWLSLRDEKLAMGRPLTNAERGTKAYRDFHGPTYDQSDKKWLPLLKELGRAIRKELRQDAD